MPSNALKAETFDKTITPTKFLISITIAMVIDIKNLVGVIVLSNVSAFNAFEGNIDQLCFELMKTLKDVNGVLYYE